MERGGQLEEGPGNRCAGEWEERVSERSLQAVERSKWEEGAVGGVCKQWEGLASERVSQWEEKGAEGAWESGRRVGK